MSVEFEQTLQRKQYKYSFIFIHSFIEKISNSLPVSEVDLSNYVDKIQDLAREKSEGVEVMIVQVEAEVVDQHLLALSLGIVINNGGVQLHHQHLYLTTFPDLPKVSWDVEHDSLSGLKIY